MWWPLNKAKQPTEVPSLVQGVATSVVFREPICFSTQLSPMGNYKTDEETRALLSPSSRFKMKKPKWLTKKTNHVPYFKGGRKGMNQGVLQRERAGALGFRVMQGSLGCCARQYWKGQVFVRVVTIFVTALAIKLHWFLLFILRAFINALFIWEADRQIPVGLPILMPTASRSETKDGASLNPPFGWPSQPSPRGHQGRNLESKARTRYETWALYYGKQIS